ncbi:MAG: EamA family transporter [Ilumatobacteraceae bacterium]
MHRGRGMLQALSAMAMVGAAVTASTYLTDYPRYTAQAVRYVVATVVLVACDRRYGSARLRRPAGSEWWWLVGSATVGLTAYNLAVLQAVEHAEPAVVGTIVACVPLVLAIGAPLIQRGRVPIGVVAAAVVVVVGAVTVVGGGRSSVAGVTWSFVALTGEAGFTLLAVPVLARLGAFSVATHTTWIAAGQLLVLAVVLDGGQALVVPDIAVVLAVTTLVALTAAAFVLWFMAVEAVGGALAGLAAGIIPVAAAVTGLAVGLTTLNGRVALGTVLVAAGIVGGLAAAGRAAQASPIAGTVNDLARASPDTVR